ncbi:MAG: kynureninase [Cyclobacteriaceae bacterium]|nr:kynureninase [Cyclobacteriaceae bacterium]MCH8516887.1 kynureninase [Cyclobacteriaceae bacterium]
MAENYQNNRAYAQSKDDADSLARLREQFIFPLKNDGNPKIYFCGNSLGLQPKNTVKYIEKELSAWAEYAVDGHFHTDDPWYHFHKKSKPALASLVGAKEDEVVTMNNLTANLHHLMFSFYVPQEGRYKILTEAGAFPSDQYVLESQVRFHGYDPDDAIIEVKPLEGEECLRTEQILEAIADHKNELALVMMAGVQYYTGQLFDMARITAEAKKYGIVVGFDLAHAIGNVPLQLHDWGVDFATWCSYKYLCSSPGGVSGIFVHERHGDDKDRWIAAGWWGHDEKERFLMKKGFIPMKGADGWQQSNTPVLLLAAHQAALDIVLEAGGIQQLRKKSVDLTSYLFFLVEMLEQKHEAIKIITPKDTESRGSQMSLYVKNNGKKIFDYLHAAGVVGDWREPNVIRIAPKALYNTYTEVFEFYELLQAAADLYLHKED